MSDNFFKKFLKLFGNIHMTEILKFSLLSYLNIIYKVEIIMSEYLYFCSNRAPHYCYTSEYSFSILEIWCLTGKANKCHVS